MPTLFFGIVVLVLVLWGLNAYSKADPKYLAKVMRPSVEAVVSGRPDRNVEALVSEAVRANVRASVDHLRHGSPLLEALIQRDGLRVVGAEYSLESGVVTFFGED